MIAIYPSLRLSANGAVALLDTVEGGFKLLSFPDLTVHHEGTYEGVVDLTLSGFGESLGIRMTNGEILVIHGSEKQRYQLPRDQFGIRALALSDAGDRVALLRHDEQASTQLDIWSLPPAAEPLSTISVLPLEGGYLAANPSFTRFAVLALNAAGDGPRLRAIYATRTGDNRHLRVLWHEAGTSVAGTSVALSDEWVWVAADDGLIGWHGDEPPVTLPGTTFDTLSFSPTASHLLAWRVERLVSPTTAEILVRVIDLATLTETARATYSIDQFTTAHPALAPDLSLLIFRAARDGAVTMERYELLASG